MIKFKFCINCKKKLSRSAFYSKATKCNSCVQKGKKLSQEHKNRITKARAEVKLEDFQETMKDVWTSSANIHTLDEAPMAYKSKDLIVKNITDTVDIEFFMKPVYNFKDDTPKRRRRKNNG